MKTFLTAAAIVTALAMPAFAEGDDASAKSGEAKGNLKASTQQGTPGSEADRARGAMGQGQIRGSTTGAGAADPAKESAGTSTNPGKKTGVTTGGDNGGSGGGRGGGEGGSDK
jgi:hypothetical protein